MGGNPINKQSCIDSEKGKNPNGLDSTPTQQNNSQDLSVKEMLDNLKKVIDENSISKLCISSSRDLASSEMINCKESTSSSNKPMNINERLIKLTKYVNHTI